MHTDGSLGKAAAVWVPVSSLHPWAKNPRKNDPAVDKVADSITRFGFGAPLLARQANGEIIAGHTRLKAALKLGLAEVPVRYLDLTESAAHTLALADNKLGEIAGWDDAELSAILLDLQKEGQDIRGAGFDAEDLTRLLAALNADQAPESKAPPKPAGGGPLHGEWRVEHGDVLNVLRTYPDNHFDALLSDPPYGISFMNRTWDYGLPSVEIWREVLRVLKPGAPLIAFSATRTYHRLAVSIEDAGFEIRDCFAWLYGSGFPKSHDVSKAIDESVGATRPVIGSYKATGTAARKSAGGGVASYGTSAADAGTTYVDPDARIYQTAPATPLAAQWDGYGTALKPAFEPAVLARKPLEGTVVENVRRWGVGGLAIDACRIACGEEKIAPFGSPKRSVGGIMNGTTDARESFEQDVRGRWPANVLLDEGAAALLDEQSGERKSGISVTRNGGGGKIFGGMREGVTGHGPRPDSGYLDSGGASRFFFVAKASRREREVGLEQYAKGVGALRDGGRSEGTVVNGHPTVKPVTLVGHLARLILPPARAANEESRRLLVPFAGSGSEIIGALLAGWDDVTGIEREVEYVELARARVAYAIDNPLDFATDDGGDDDDG